MVFSFFTRDKEERDGEETFIIDLQYIRYNVEQQFTLSINSVMFRFLYLNTSRGLRL